MPGSPTTPGRAGTRNDAPVYVAFREYDHVGSRIVSSFRGSMASLCAPLPTHGLGPVWIANLHRNGLAPSTPCRFDRRTIMQEQIGQ
jgi:hypothetical protein